MIEGDSVKNFGEFIPNPYIEKITVTETGKANIINLNIEYSLLFLVGDEFDVDDVVELFYDNAINIYGLLEAKINNSPSTKSKLVSNIHDQKIDDEKPIRTNTQDNLGFVKIFGSEALADALSDGDLQTETDLYDSDGRQILKIYSNVNIEVNTTGFNEEYLYFYLFCSTITSASISSAISINESLLSLSIGDITYEKIFSPGLVISSEEQNSYTQPDGSKFGFTPLLSTNREFYNTNTVTREMVLKKTQGLANRFKNGKSGTLADMVSSIEYVLETQGQTENIIPELDKIRKSFPNKTNNNPVGNLYASLSQLLININSSFLQTERLERQRYATGKVIDARTEIEPELLTLPSAANGTYFIEPLITRTATEDSANNDGVIFFNFKDMIKKESIFFTKYVDADRFYEVCDEFGISGLKRSLYSKMKEKSFKIEVSCNSIKLKVDSTKLNYSFQNPNNLMITYAFQHKDEIPASPVTFDYDITARFEDSTQELLFELLDSFTEAYNNIKRYQTQASSFYSYNQNTQNFNTFFKDSAKVYWEANNYIYPWELTPVVYAVLAYLTTDRFDSVDNLRTYTKNIIFNISPETGSPNHLNNFILILESFIEDITNKLSDSFSLTKPTLTQNLKYSKDLTTFGLISDTEDTESSGDSTSSGTSSGTIDTSYLDYISGISKEERRTI